MKRNGDSKLDLERKRHKAAHIEQHTDSNGEDDVLFQPSQERRASDIRQSGSDGTGYLEGRVHMKWPPMGGKVQLIMETKENGNTFRFDVSFADGCAKLLVSSGVNFSVGDRFQLSLNGAIVEASTVSKSNVLGLSLNYRDGVALKFVSRSRAVDPLQSVNSFAGLTQNVVVQPPLSSQCPGIPRPFHDAEVKTPLAIQSTSNEIKRVDSVSGRQNTLVASSKSEYLRPGIPEQRSPSASSVTSVRSVNPGSSLNSHSASLPEFVQGSSAVVPGATKAVVLEHTTKPKTTNFSNLSKKAEKSARRRQRAALKATEQARQTPPPQVQVAVIENKETLAVQTSLEQSDIQASNSLQHPSISVSPGKGSVVSESGRSTPPPTIHDLNGLIPARSPVPTPTPVKHENSAHGDPALNLRAGCSVSKHPYDVQYAPLASLASLPRFPSMQNVIGIILDVGDLRETRKGEYCRRVTLVDPSNLVSHDLEKGLSINCFTASRQHNLPDGISKGDILLLRDIRVQEYKGNLQYLAPSMRQWTWAVVDLKSLRRHQDDSSAGSPSSFQPCQEEIQYCIRLNDWWNAVQEEHGPEGSNQPIHHDLSAIGATSIRADSRRQNREHRLLKDASPDAPPQGYFDCTVEVLYKYDNTNNRLRIYNLYVTDYTRNELFIPQQSDWCPPGLLDRVLQIEMWDDAALAAEDMQPGEFYLLRNVRMRYSQGGGMAGKLVENKITKLDVDELDSQPYLAELLQRKAEWQRTAEEQGENKFPHRLLEETIPDKFFRCTVQVLGISHKDDERSYLYATDYTCRNDFASVWFDRQPGDLVPNDRILKVLLLDEQAKTAKSLKPGDFVSLRHIRLRTSEYRGEVRLTGRMGGNQRLIFKLNAQGTGNEDLIALLQRKEEWEVQQKSEQGIAQQANGKMTNGRKQKQEPQATMGDDLAPKKPQRTAAPGTMTIKQIQRCTTCPARFLVRARIVSLYPLELEDCVVLHCTGCKEDVPKGFRICTKCVDNMSDTSVVPRYQFFFMIEDEDGDTLIIAINRNDNSLLDGLEAADFHEDFDAFEDFRERLAPIIGNLEEVNRAVERGRVLEPNTPFVQFEIGSWLNKRNERAYVFLNHSLLHSAVES
ncbi:unnamed protein product [Somion occarium]|uniref:Protection of telomeres protein 1 n=1 Tax=Somion occarium TaxID=3059160 RepID=A0ABP1DEB6_9APHY